MRKRALVIPISAVIIAALCTYRLLREEETQSPAAATRRRPAPPFELFNSESPPKPVRLAAYLGRHRILLVFFDRELGADRDPQLQWLIRNAQRVEDAGILVFAVSGALPPENRSALERLSAAEQAAPFVLLTDPPPTPGAAELGYLVHKQWGRYDKATGRPLTGLFLIDRAGRVEWDDDGPLSVKLNDPKLKQFLDDP